MSTVMRHVDSPDSTPYLARFEFCVICLNSRRCAARKHLFCKWGRNYAVVCWSAIRVLINCFLSVQRKCPFSFNLIVSQWCVKTPPFNRSRGTADETAGEPIEDVSNHRGLISCKLNKGYGVNATFISQHFHSILSRGLLYSRTVKVK